MEVEAVDEGTLGKILVADGTEDVAVNTPIAVILGEGEKAGDNRRARSSTEGSSRSFTRPAATPSAPSGRRSSSAAGSKTNGSDGRIFASPLARRIAKQKGLDLQHFRVPVRTAASS